jgi:hypothetical protein
MATTNLIQQDINLRVQLNSDGQQSFLRIWHHNTRKGKWVDVLIEGPYIPHFAHMYTNNEERNSILKLLR